MNKPQGLYQPQQMVTQQQRPAQPTTGPAGVANYQGYLNQQAAIQNAALNRVNTRTPWGSQTYGISGYNADGTPIYEQNINLSGPMQDLFERQYDQDKQLSRAGVDLSGQIRNRGAFSLGPNTPGLASNVQGGNIQQSVQNNGPALQGQIGYQGNPLQSGYQSFGPQMSVNRQGLPDLPQDLSAFRNQAEGALYDRNTAYLDQQFGRDEQGLRSRLANQGIVEGTEAYKHAMDDFNRGKEMSYRQARNESIAGGGAEASRMFDIGSRSRGQLYGEELTSGDFRNQAAAQATGQNLTAAQFANQARGQGFGESLAGGQFTNDARQQAMAEALASGQFANEAQGQQFGQGMANAQLTNQARGQSINEQFAMRNQPMNELAAIRNMTQVQMPQFDSMAQVGVNPVDYMSQANAEQNARTGSRNSLMGGLFGLGSSLISALPEAAWSFLSDERAKEDIHPVGKLNDGTGVYLYRYKGDDTPQVGVIAQEVEETNPQAVTRGKDGLRRVNYGKVLAKALAAA